MERRKNLRVENAEKHLSKKVEVLAVQIKQPRLLELLRRFLYTQMIPENAQNALNVPLAECPRFFEKVDGRWVPKFK